MPPETMLFSDQLHSLSSRFEENKMPFMPLLIRRITLAIYDVDSSFVAGLCTQPAAVAFFFVYMDDLADHFY